MSSVSGGDTAGCRLLFTRTQKRTANVYSLVDSGQFLCEADSGFVWKWHGRKFNPAVHERSSNTCHLKQNSTTPLYELFCNTTKLYIYARSRQKQSALPTDIFILPQNEMCPFMHALCRQDDEYIQAHLYMYNGIKSKEVVWTGSILIFLFYLRMSIKSLFKHSYWALSHLTLNCLDQDGHIS